MSYYIFQYTLINTMRQYAMLAADEYLSAGGANDETTQRSLLEARSDVQLANEAICSWALDDMDLDVLQAVFADLRERLLVEPA